MQIIWYYVQYVKGLTLQMEREHVMFVNTHQEGKFRQGLSQRVSLFFSVLIVFCKLQSTLAKFG